MTKLNKIPKAEFRKLIDQVLSDSDDASKAAMKTIVARRYDINIPARRAVYEYFPITDKVYADAKRYERLLRLLNIGATFDDDPNHKQIVLDEAWRGLEHESGMVRQAARALFEAWRSMGGFNDMGSFRNYLPAMMERLEKLMQKYSPKRDIVSVESAPASVYKTLNLVWHDLAGFLPEDEYLGSWEHIMDNDHILPYSDPDPYEEDDLNVGEYELEDWKERIGEYIICKNLGRVRELLLAQQKRAEYYLDWALSELGLEKHKSAILDRAKKGDTPAQIRATIEITLAKADKQEASTDKHVLDVLNTNKLFRAVMAVDLHTVHESYDGEPFSAAAVEAILGAMDLSRFVPVDLDAFVAGYVAVHDKIDEYAKTVIMVESKSALKKLNQLRKQFGDEEEGYDGGELIEATQIAHHQLDQLYNEEYKQLAKRDPHNIAACMWWIFKNNNHWVGLSGLESAELNKYGGWNSASGVGGASDRYKGLINYRSINPILLYMARDDWELEMLREQIKRLTIHV